MPPLPVTMTRGIGLGAAVYSASGILNRRPKAREDTKLDRGLPPAPPPQNLEMGSYCIRAKCKFLRGDLEVGNVVGHDDRMAIVAVVEEACRVNAKHRGLTCTKAAVTVLPDLPGRICDGIVFNVDESEHAP